MVVSSMVRHTAFSCYEHGHNPVCSLNLAGFKMPVYLGGLVRLELREPTQCVLSIASVLLACSIELVTPSCSAQSAIFIKARAVMIILDCVMHTKSCVQCSS